MIVTIILLVAFVAMPVPACRLAHRLLLRWDVR